MQLHIKQSEVIKSDKRFKLLNWGRRAGKTSCLAYEAFIDLYNKDKALVSYYAPTTTDARDIAWEIFKETLGKTIIKTNEVLLEIKVRNKFGGESTLRLAGWEAVKNRDKGRGVENDLVILDEVAFYPQFKEKFEKVIEPTLLTSKGRLILTSTPNGFNHFYDSYNEAVNNPLWFVSHATSYDNPHNDPEELARLKKEKDQDVFAQEYLADFRKIQGLVYKDFNRERHVFDPETVVINKRDEIAGIDWGYTNPLAMLRIFVDNDNNFFIYDEYYRTEKTTEEAIEFLGTWKPSSVYPDPAEPDRNVLLAKAGYYVKDVNKDIKSGIDKVISLFRNNKIFVSKNCVELITELESYRYDEKLSKEIPVKESDHCFAPDTLIKTTKGYKKIKDMVGEAGYLYSIDNRIEKYHNVRPTRSNAETLKIEFEDKSMLEVTPDHLLLLSNGEWIEAQLLNPMDLIQSDTYATANIQWVKLLSLSWREILQQVKQKIAQSCMGILQWKDRERASCSPHRRKFTQQCDRKLGAKICSRTFESAHDTREEGKSESMGRDYSTTYKEMAWVKRGESVALDTWEECNGEATANRKELCLLSREVFNKEKEYKCKILSSELQNESKTKKIERITRGFQGVVYNLEVENTHCLIANGVIAHNCMDSLRYSLFMYTGSIPVARNTHTSKPKPINKAL